METDITPSDDPVALTQPEPTVMPEKPKRPILPIMLGVLAILALAGGGIYFKNSRQSSFADITPRPTISEPTKIPTLTNSLTPTVTPIPTATPIPTPVLFSLGIGTIDFSRNEAKGDVPGAKVKLYDSNGKYLNEGIVPPIVMQGNVGSGGHAFFSVPLGTYTAIAETARLTGKVSVTLKTMKDQQYYSIYMTAKPITIVGKYFLDSNKDRQYSAGEPVFTNKRIDSFIKTGPATFQHYSGKSTTTDDSGNFSITNETEGSYTLGPEYVPGHQQPSQEWQDLVGGQTVTHNVYLWPL